jgi:hypothetical protein
MDMRYLVPTLIALVGAVARFGGIPLAHLTLVMAERAADHQQHMMSLGKLNRALVGSQRKSRGG